MAQAMLSAKDNFKVVVKSRPLIKRERDLRQTSQWKINGDSIECINPQINQRYTFDHIYGENSTTQELYDQVARPIVKKSVQGFNGTIFAYGQTSSGKTYTMLGDKKNPGIIRLAARQIFSDIMLHQQERTFIVRVNYLEIYNEKVYDLLNDRKEIKIQEFPNGELKFGCNGQKVQHEDDILKLVDAGNNHRKVAETNMNVQSSRSHAILQVGIESILECDGASQVSVLNLVDLAGSERADSTGAVGERLKEAGNINKSLLTLSLVINKLSEDPDGHICYRDSKLTRMLQTSLGGNSMTVMICAITPAALDETNLTLGFATRAKKIENKPIINETVSDAVEVKRLKRTIVKLEEQLASKSKEILEFQKTTNELKILKQITIQAPKQTHLPAKSRRKTWASCFDMPNDLDTVIEVPEKEMTPSGCRGKETLDAVNINRPIYLMFGDEGRHVQCSEEDFDSFLNDTMGKLIVDFDVDEEEITAQTAMKFPIQPASKQVPIICMDNAIEDDHVCLTPITAKAPATQARKSLLRTPKSLRHKFGKNDFTPVTLSSIASPIALDKDKRIRMLEVELEELHHFKQTESMVYSSQTDTLQAELEKKSCEFSKLDEKLNETLDELNKIKEQFETLQFESKEMKKDKLLAIKAKVVAEQNMAGIELEFEQFKKRATRREKELVEQLDSLGNDEQMKVLKEKITTMTEKVNSLETQLWQDENKHKTEIDSLNAKVFEEQQRYNQALRQLDKFATLRHEYDEVSAQIVDNIQENDALKKECSDFKVTVEKLNAEITELKSQLSAAATNEDLQSEQQKQIQANTLEIEKLQEKHAKEIEDLKASNVAAVQQLEQTIRNHSSEVEKMQEECRKVIEELNQTKAHHADAIQELEQKIATTNADFQDKIQKQNQDHETEIDAMKEVQRKEIEILNDQQALQVQSFEKVISDHGSELKALVEKHSKEVKELEQDKTNQLNVIQELKRTIAEQKEEIMLTASKQLEQSITNHSSEIEKLQEEHREAIEELNQSKAHHADAIQILEQKIATLNADFQDQIQKQNQDHETEIDALKNNHRKELEALNEQQASQVIEIQKFDEVIGNYESAINALMEKHSKEVDELQQDKNDQLNIIQKYEQTITEQNDEILLKTSNVEAMQQLKQTIANHSSEIEKLQEERREVIEELNQTKAHHADAIQELEQKIAAANADFQDQLQKQNQDHETEIDAMKKFHCKELEALNEQQASQMVKIQRLEKVISDHESELNALAEKHGKELEELRQDKASQLDVIQELERTIANQKGEIMLKSSNADAVQQLEQTIANHSFEIEKLQDERRKAIEELNQSKAHHADTIQALEQKIATANTVFQDQLQKQNKDHKTEIDELKNNHRKEIETLNEQHALQVQNFEQVISDHESELKALMEKHSKEVDEMLRQNKADQLNVIQELERTIANQKSEIMLEASKVAAMQELEQAIANHLSEIEKLQDERRKAIEELNQTKALHANAIQVLEQKIATANADFQDRLQKEGQNHESEIDALKNNQRKELKNLNEQQALQTIEVQRLEKVISNHESTIKALVEKHSKEVGELRQDKINQLDVIHELEQTIGEQKNEIMKIKIDHDELLSDYNQLEHSNTLLHNVYSQTRMVSDLILKEIDVLRIGYSELQMSTAVQELEHLKLQKTFDDTINFSTINETTNQITANNTKLIDSTDSEKKHDSVPIAELHKSNEERDSLASQLDSILKRLASVIEVKPSASQDEINHILDQLVTDCNELNEIKAFLGVDKNSTENVIEIIRNRQTEIESEKASMNKSSQKVIEPDAKDLRMNTSKVRKIKRQSIHDDTRRLSGFDTNMIELGTQTDPVGEMCACADMAEQIKKLKRDLIIIQSRYETFKRSTGVDQLNEENKKLKADLVTIKEKFCCLNRDHENLVEKYEKLKLKSVIAQQKPPSSDATMQTDAPPIAASFVDQMDWDRVNRRIEKYKMAYEGNVANYKQLKENYDRMKLEFDEKSAKCAELAEWMEEIKPKYSNMKRLCNSRYDQITEFKARIAIFEKNEIEMKQQIDTLNQSLIKFKETTEEVVRYKRKYEVAKQICDSRRMELERLNRIVKENSQNIENVAVNK